MALDETTAPPPDDGLGAGEGRSRRGGWHPRVVVVAVGVLLVLVGAGLYAVVATSGTDGNSALVERTGQPAPQFSLPELSDAGRIVSPATFLGHELVLNFWASWCGPCQTETPLLESAYRASHGRTEFLGVDTNDTRSAAVSFLARVHATYESVFDPHGHAASLYQLYGLPTTIFISARGTVLGRHIGQMSASTLRAALQEAFGTTWPT